MCSVRLYGILYIGSWIARGTKYSALLQTFR